MRRGALVREAWRNVVTGSANTIRTTTAAIALILILATADLVTLHQLSAQAKNFANSGGSTTIILARGRVDPNRCDGLADIPGVRASGALRETDDPVRPAALPTGPLPVFEASAGLADVLGADVSGAGLLLGPEAVEALGVSAGASLAVSGGAVTVGGSYPYPADGRRPGLSYASIAPIASTEGFDECWVDVRPPRDVHAALLATVRPGTDDDTPQLMQLNGTLGATFDGQSRFEQRITRFAGPFSALAGLLLGFAAVRSRRLVLASALHAGVSRADLIAVTTLESAAWTVASAAVALPVIVVAALATEGPAAGNLQPAMLIAATLWSGGLVGSILAATTIRERSLFRYFKAR